MKINIKKLRPDAIIPKYQTSGASGFDFHAEEEQYIPAGETRLVKTGLAFEIPEGYELQVRPRSGLSLKTMLRVANAPGTVDADFRGEVCIIITNTEPRDGAFINKCDRIAQGVIAPIVQVEFQVVDELNESGRGTKGFGSTNK